MTNTIAVVMAVSRREGQVTFWVSARTSCINLKKLVLAMFCPGHVLPWVDPTRLGWIERAASRRTQVPTRAVAGVEGLEPPTPGFGDRCSNQLSYTPLARVANRWPGQHCRRAFTR